MKIIGIDIGNANTQTSEGVGFESKIKNGITQMNEDDLKIIYSGNKYTVGAIDGALNISKNKYRKPHYKISLLTAIAKSFSEDRIQCKVVANIPIEPFNNKKITDTIEGIIKTFRNETIFINNKKKIITIEDAKLFCESGIVYTDRKRFRKEKTLVIDFGGSTVDISYWNGLRLEKFRTYIKGMFTLYEDIIKAVNDKYKTNLHSSVAKDMIGERNYKIEQKNRDISFIQDIVQNYVDGLISFINQYFPYEDADSIQLIGGGAIALETLLKDEYENAELFENAEFANANAFKEVGNMIWNK